VAAALARRLEPGDVLALGGPLGAGKTCFVRGLAGGLGVDPREVSSPTFVLCHEYGGVGGASESATIVLIHLDGYRLSSPEELEGIGWEEMLRAGEGVIAVEWPERFGDALPRRRIDVELAHGGGDCRVITVRWPSEETARFAAFGEAWAGEVRSPGQVDG